MLNKLEVTESRRGNIEENKKESKKITWFKLTTYVYEDKLLRATHLIYEWNTNLILQWRRNLRLTIYWPCLIDL